MSGPTKEGYKCIYIYIYIYIHMYIYIYIHMPAVVYSYALKTCHSSRWTLKTVKGSRWGLVEPGLRTPDMSRGVGVLRATFNFELGKLQPYRPRHRWHAHRTQIGEASVGKDLHHILHLPSVCQVQGCQDCLVIRAVACCLGQSEEGKKQKHCRFRSRGTELQGAAYL